MSRVAFCDVRGLLNDLNDKLGGEQGDRWTKKLANMLREATFSVWRKIPVGFVPDLTLLRNLLGGCWLQDQLLR